MYRHLYPLLILALPLLILSCTDDTPSWEGEQNSDNMLVSVEGLDGPEAVRYEPEQDLWFVSNFNGSGGAADSNGYISTITAEGEIDQQRFITGSEEAPLHAPRGMYIKGDTLWVADLLGVHAFHRESGEALAFVDFTSLEPGFLNDITEGDDGAIYVTDTGTAAVYRISGLQAEMAYDSLPAPPNGITRNPASGALILAPWGGSRAFFSLSSGAEPDTFARAESGGDFDGIEFFYDRLIAASQNDSSLHVLQNGRDRAYIHLPGPPADIGIDTRRGRVAVPYIALNRVDIWQLPEE